VFPEIYSKRCSGAPGYVTYASADSGSHKRDAVVPGCVYSDRWHNHCPECGLAILLGSHCDSCYRDKLRNAPNAMLLSGVEIMELFLRDAKWVVWTNGREASPKIQSWMTNLGIEEKS
jgi:hypothetical protein